MMENSAGHFGRAVERNIESEYPPQQPAGNVSVASYNVPLDVAAGRKKDAVGSNRAQDLSMNVKIAFGVEAARDRKATSESRRGNPIAVAAKERKFHVLLMRTRTSLRTRLRHFSRWSAGLQLDFGPMLSAFSRRSATEVHAALPIPRRCQE